jgi:hypothetical protein
LRDSGWGGSCFVDSFDCGGTLFGLAGAVGLFGEGVDPWGALRSNDKNKSNGKSKSLLGRVCVPQPSPDQAGSGWGTPEFFGWLRRTGNDNSKGVVS